MSTPNPLIPQGTFQAQAAKGATNVRIAVATIVAIHIVFFGGLLLQGCKGGNQNAQNAATETNAEANVSSTLPSFDTNQLFYTNSGSLPQDSVAASGALSPATNAGLPASPQPATSTPEAIWQPSNLGSSQLGSTAAPSGQSSGATKEYTIVRGDKLSTIAKAHGVSLSALRAANPNIDPNRIREGAKLNIPEATQVSPQSGSATTGGPAAGSGNNSSGTTVYTVKPGDNLTRIAKAHGVTISQIRSANNLKTGRIDAGQKLRIPQPQPRAATSTTSNLPPGSGL